MKKIAYLLIALTTMVFTFTSCSDVPMPYEQPSIYDDGSTSKPEGDGSAANPFNIAAAVAKCKEVGNTLSEEKYYIKGYVTKATTADATYGNATFTMSDDTEGNGGSFTAYQIAGNNGDKLTAGYAFNVGDIVTIYGKIYNYNGSTPETEGKGAAWLIAHEKSGSGGGGGLDVIKKVTVAEFNAAEVENDTWYEMTGTVKNLKDGDQYGNFDLEDATGSVYVYGLLAEKGGEKKKFQELVAKYGIANGSTITIRANRGDYQGKIEAMNAYIVPEGGGGSSESTTVADFLAAPVSTDTWYQLTGTVKNLKDGDQYGNFDLEDATGSVYVYGLLSEKGGEKKKFQELVAQYGIANGSKITIMGNRGEYKGNAQVTNAYFVSIEGGGSGGSDTPSGSGDGTKNSPYSVSAAQAAGDKTGAYMKGYIVGFVSGQVYADGATFSADGAVASNVLLADSPNETDASKCMPIQLPSGSAVRTALNLQNNASNLKKEVTLYGDLTKYFGQAGLKNVTFAILDGTEIGTNPDGGGESGGGANHGTEAKPLTVAQAFAVIDAEGTASDCYVKGIICQIDSYNSTYKSIQYWISDDGGTTTKLEVYSGKGLNGADFTSKDDLQTGKTVIIKGNLKKYNDIYEFDKSSSIISIQ
jgi:uncharacterized protein YdeI (BOF family)